MPNENPYSAPQTANAVPIAALVEDPVKHRRARTAILVNGILWVVGNTLTTGPFILFLAKDLGAKGFGLSLLLALPNLAGMMRLASPWIHSAMGNSKRFYLAMTVPSYLLIMGLPIIDFHSREWPSTLLIVLIGLIFVHQMFEYLGQLALWHWWGDLISENERGKFFGMRQGLQLVFVIPCGLLLSWFVDHVKNGGIPALNESHAYAIAHGIGALFLLGSIVPFLFLKAPPPVDLNKTEQATSSALAAYKAVFRDRGFWRFLLFRIWFSFANGITQSVQFTYTASVLRLSILPQTIFKLTMQVGQMLISFLVGPICDRIGYRSALVVAQTFVTAALGVYLVVRPDWGVNPWWLIVAWILWSAYAVHNLAFPNITLNFAPREFRSGYLASSDAFGNLTHAVTTIIGGLVFDFLQKVNGGSDFAAKACLQLLLIGFLARGLAVFLAMLIRDPQKNDTVKSE